MSLTLEEVRSLGDPQRSYKWRVTMPSMIDPAPKKGSNFLDKGLREFQRNTNISKRLPSIIGSNIDVFFDRQNNFNPSDFVEEVQGLPIPGVSQETFYEGGRNRYFPGIETLEPVIIVFYQNESSDIPNYFLDWKRQIVNPDGTKNYPDSYKKSIKVELLNGRNQPVFIYRLVDCFPTATTPLQLNQQSERVTWTQEFSVDKVEIITTGIEEETARDKLMRRMKALTESQLKTNSKFVNDITSDIIKKI